jgi:hypothetical protein
MGRAEVREAADREQRQAFQQDRQVGLVELAVSTA